MARNPMSRTEEEILILRAFLSSGSVPVGFGFRPTDEELVGHYLKGHIDGSLRPIDEFMVPQVDVYKSDPWDLRGDDHSAADPNKSLFQSGEPMWYFLSRKDLKYSKGRSVNRSTPNGYWKVTGQEQKIMESPGSPSSLIGKKRTLTFHMHGGIRTNWTIHEYTAADHQDGFVLCCLIMKPVETLLKTRRKSKEVVCETESSGLSPTAGGSQHSTSIMQPVGINTQNTSSGLSPTAGGSQHSTSIMQPVGINTQNTISETKFLWHNNMGSSSTNPVTEEARQQVGYYEDDYIYIADGRLGPGDYRCSGIQEELIQDDYVLVDSDKYFGSCPATSAMMDCSSFNGSDRGISHENHNVPGNEEDAEAILTKVRVSSLGEVYGIPVSFDYSWQMDNCTLQMTENRNRPAFPNVNTDQSAFLMGSPSGLLYSKLDEDMNPIETESLSVHQRDMESQTSHVISDGTGIRTRTPQHLSTPEDFPGQQGVLLKKLRLQKCIHNTPIARTEKYLSAQDNEVYKLCSAEVGGYDKHLIRGETPVSDVVESNPYHGNTNNNDMKSIASEATVELNSKLRLRSRIVENGEHSCLSGQVSPAVDSSTDTRNLAVLMAIILLLSKVLIFYLIYMVWHNLFLSYGGY